MLPESFGQFTPAEPKVTWLVDGRNIRLDEPLTFTRWNGEPITVQSGYVSDGATIPEAVWSLVGAPEDGRYRLAAVLHDWLTDAQWRTSRQTARVFYEAMRSLGVPWWRAWAFANAVRLAGRKWGSLSDQEG